MRPIVWTVGVAAAALVSTMAVGSPDRPDYSKAASIPAPDGRWDFASWDAAHKRVLVAHGSDVLIIDPSGSGSAQTIGKIAGAHGALAIPDSNSVLVSSGKDNTVRILDAASGAELASIPVAADPDAAILSSDGRTAYVMGAKAGSISIIDLTRRIETGRIALKPALEVPILVSSTLLAVNNEDQNEIEFADLSARKAAGVIALPGCTGPTGLAYAPLQGLALSACANGKAALVDIRTRRLVSLLPIGQGPDTVIWDAAHHRFLVPCGRSGGLSIISLDGRTAHVQPSVETETSARTAALDPETGRLYLPAARFEPAQAGQRPAMQAGSFHLVVLAPRS